MTCKICGGETKSLGTVPFDRNNAGVPIVNDTPMEYVQCLNCEAVSCPEMLEWSASDLASKVYNEDYVLYDADYKSLRPTNYANTLCNLVPWPLYPKFKHLDYGSGSGIMVDILNTKTWKSTAYDPYSSVIRPEGKFKFITAIEVVEHALDIRKTLKDIESYLDKGGIIYFSTLFAFQDVDINWWYIGARNGHINILSERSIKILAKELGLRYRQLSANIHILQRENGDFSRFISGSFV